MNSHSPQHPHSQGAGQTAAAAAAAAMTQGQTWMHRSMEAVSCLSCQAQACSRTRLYWLPPSLCETARSVWLLSSEIGFPCISLVCCLCYHTCPRDDHGGTDFPSCTTMWCHNDLSKFPIFLLFPMWQSCWCCCFTGTMSPKFDATYAFSVLFIVV